MSPKSLQTPAPELDKRFACAAEPAAFPEGAMRRMIGAISSARSPYVYDLISLASDRQAFEPILEACLDPSTGPFAGFTNVRLLLEERADMPTLTQLKQAAKRGFSSANVGSTDDPIRSAVLGFALVAAAMRAHHGSAETNVDPDALDDLLLALCGCGIPWVADLAARALGSPA